MHHQKKKGGAGGRRRAKVLTADSLIPNGTVKTQYCHLKSAKPFEPKVRLENLKLSNGHKEIFGKNFLSKNF